LEQFQHTIEINKKYHTVGTVLTYDRNKQQIPHCWYSSNIRLFQQSCIFLFISIISWNCSNCVVFFVYFYHMLELFQQSCIFCLFLSYVRTVPTVWYFLFISIVCWNCTNSLVYVVYFGRLLEVPTYDRNKQKIPHCWNGSKI
jgi:hypothetical protein